MEERTRKFEALSIVFVLLLTIEVMYIGVNACLRVLISSLVAIISAFYYPRGIVAIGQAIAGGIALGITLIALTATTHYIFAVGVAVWVITAKLLIAREGWFFYIFLVIDEKGFISWLIYICVLTGILLLPFLLPLFI